MISKLQIELLKEKADIAEIRLQSVDTDLTEVDTKGPTAPKVIGFLVHCKKKYGMFTLHVYRPGSRGERFRQTPFWIIILLKIILGRQTKHAGMKGR